MSVIFCQTLPLLKIRNLDFLGLKAILAHDTTSSSADWIHRACMWDSVVMVRSSINPLCGRRLISV
ncbi:hypothetical protein DPMN_056015 [Dreissena polymorpha]|uniref:Uncharacterized protein n=1 Tax=Dreissena polymorpha TaxID=45954 RepID=A0A9D4CRS5_DREPO|nr:hypothetical protein DPMN_056015 [Dreissena polymorpha]